MKVEHIQEAYLGNLRGDIDELVERGDAFELAVGKQTGLRLANVLVYRDKANELPASKDLLARWREVPVQGKDLHTIRKRLAGAKLPVAKITDDRDPNDPEVKKKKREVERKKRAAARRAAVRR